MQWIEASSFRKNIAVLILVFVALILITSTVLLYKKVTHFGANPSFTQTISVNGRAEEFIKPDTLTFNITVNEEATTVVLASKKVDAKILKAMEILKANGVEEKNVKTISRDVNDTYGTVSEPCTAATPMVSGVSNIAMPVSRCVNTTSKVTGASVYQTLEVKIPEIDKDVDGTKQEKLITDLGAAGIKTGSVSYTVFDLESVKSRIRAEAIKKAKAEAKVLARQLDVDLGDLQGFSDTGSGYPIAPWMSARADMMMNESSKQVAGAALPAGEQKVTSEVTLTYLLK